LVLLGLVLLVGLALDSLVTLDFSAFDPPDERRGHDR
jgi:hypothetical protein